MRSKPTSRAEGVVEKLVAGGDGLVRLDGEVIFVPRVAPGERVAFEIDRSRKPARGRLLKVLEPSRDRVDAPCARFDRCGGCDLMHLSRDGQREARLSILREALGDVPITWHDATPAHGRTRARLHVRPVGGRIVAGFHATGSNTIVDLEGCGALDPRLLPAIDDIRAICATNKGDGEASIALGAGGKPVLSISWRPELPMTAFGEADRRVREGRLAGVEITMQGVNTPARIGDPRPVFVASDGLPVYAPPRGFAQASDIGDRVLVDLVVQRANSKGLRVLELFAGSGNFTVALAREAAHVTAVELDPAASAASRENVGARGLANVKSVAADADNYPIPKDTELVVLDPPRSGARGAAAAIAANKKVKRVVYVSCDPTTLARDLGTLASFELASVDAVDLFPDTSHVETVAVLQRRPGAKT